MKKILVAGAGHGGLVAAAKLADAGYDVTVLEARKEGTLGHDWEDGFSLGNLAKVLGITVDDLPSDLWRPRGDGAFFSPSKDTKIVVHYGPTGQRVVWRKTLINMLLDHAVKHGVEIRYGVKVLGPAVENDRVTGVITSEGEVDADLVIDAAGAFSPVRLGLPDEFGIDKMPKPGDVFYGHRGYYSKAYEYQPDIGFEVYLYHEKEQGLSWFDTSREGCDVLVGRVFPLSPEKVEEQHALFRKDHPWFGTELLHGGTFAIIPVRRPLTLMVADGYAAVGDSAFMTTPMNGMGIDLSLLAGGLLADTIIKHGSAQAKDLWKYNRAYHILYGANNARNHGLKGALLALPYEAIDFFFENGIIQSADLEGAGDNTSLPVLIQKLIRGMKHPKWFFTLLGGLMKGTAAAKLYRKPPEEFSLPEINEWSKKIESKDVQVEVRAH